MKKTFISAVLIISFVMYAIIHRQNMDAIPATSTKSVQSTTTQTSQTTTNSSAYKDGEYTGQAADAYYGNIQVKAIIQGGKITDVQFLQYPNDHHESIEINTRAMPQLTSEAIQAQNAQVDIVSGATDSSQAFIQSLTSALKQAQS